MSVAYPDLRPNTAKEIEVVEISACAPGGGFSGRPVLNDFGAGFALKQDASVDGIGREPKIVWVSRSR